MRRECVSAIWAWDKWLKEIVQVVLKGWQLNINYCFHMCRDNFGETMRWMDHKRGETHTSPSGTISKRDQSRWILNEIVFDTILKISRTSLVCVITFDESLRKTFAQHTIDLFFNFQSFTSAESLSCLRRAMTHTFTPTHGLMREKRKDITATWYGVRVDEEDEIYLHRKYQHLHTFRLPNEIFQQSSSSFCRLARAAKGAEMLKYEK